MDVAPVTPVLSEQTFDGDELKVVEKRHYDLLPTRKLDANEVVVYRSQGGLLILNFGISFYMLQTAMARRQFALIGGAWTQKNIQR